MQSDRNSHATVILVGVLCGSDVAPVDLIDLTSMKKKRTQSLCWLNFMADRHCCRSRRLDGSYAAGAHGVVEQEGCRPHGQNKYPLAIRLQRNKQKFHVKIWVHAMYDRE